MVASGQVSGEQWSHHQVVGSGFKHSSVWVGTFRKPPSRFAKSCASNRRREIPHTRALSPKEQQQQRLEEELLARTLEAPSSAKDTSSSLRSTQESDGS